VSELEAATAYERKDGPSASARDIQALSRGVLGLYRSEREETTRRLGTMLEQEVLGARGGGRD
jgi:hypothetical protein